MLNVDDLQGIKRWVPAAAFGLLVYALLPAVVSVYNDDFGYLRSVVQTLQHGRPWTDDWLEPWAASFSGLSALLYAAGGSFHMTTYGYLAALAALAFGSAAARFAARGFPPGAALGLAALLLTFPTLLWKGVEFTGMALYVPCLLLALGAAEQRRWPWFLLWWGLALASRQSALTWGALPAVELIRLVLTRGEERWRRRATVVAAVLVSGGGLFLVLRQGMNLTHAQEVVTGHVLEDFNGREAMKVFLAGAWVYLCAAGIGGALCYWWSRGEGEGRSAGMRAAHWVTGLAVPVLFVGGVLNGVNLEHTLFAGPVGRMEVVLGLGLALAGWGLGRFSFRWPYVFAALAGLLLVAVRGMAWDYYFIDVALFGLFGVTAKPAAAGTAPTRRERWRWVPGLALAGMHSVFFLELKCNLDRASAVCVLSEQAVRAGHLDPAELSFAPFGLAAWHLYPHYSAHEGRNNRALDGFGMYFRPGAVEVGQGYSRVLHVFPRFRHVPPADRSNLIAAGRYRFAWVFWAEFYLLRFKTEAEAPAPVRLDPKQYRLEPFPLNEAEWRALIGTGWP